MTSDENIEIDWSLFHIMVCGAIRYYMGRHTIATCGFCNNLIPLVPKMTDKTRYVIERDVAQWIEEHPTHMFGNYIDDAEPWRKLLKALRSYQSNEESEVMK